MEREPAAAGGAASTARAAAAIDAAATHAAIDAAATHAAIDAAATHAAIDAAATHATAPGSTRGPVQHCALWHDLERGQQQLRRSSVPWWDGWRVPAG